MSAGIQPNFPKSMPVPIAQSGQNLSAPAPFPGQPMPSLSAMERATAGALPGLGPMCYGVEPHRTVVKAFENAIDYRSYRLRDISVIASVDDLEIMYKIKRSVDSLAPSLGTFDGTAPIKLLHFLASFAKTVSDVGKSEAIDILLVSYYLERDASTAYKEHMTQAM